MIQLTRQLALFKQTILNDTRSVGIQLLKFLFAASLGFMVYVIQSETSRWRHIDGRYIFEMIYATNLFFVLAACLFLFLPLIKEEKEENTLGMILMTGISPFAYLLGRFGSRLFMFTLMLLVQIPVTYLCITMGGIDIPTILFSYGFLIVVAFHLGSAFILGSMLCTSIVSGIIISCGISLILNCIANFLFSVFYRVSMPENPLSTFGRCIEIIFATKTPSLTGNPLLLSYIAFLIISGILFFLAAVYFFDSLTAEQQELELPKQFKNKNGNGLELDISTGSSLFRIFKSKRFGRFPILSKDFRFSAYGYLFYAVQIIIMYWMYNELSSHSKRDLKSLCRNLKEEYFFIACGSILVSSNIVFSSEIKGKTLSSLLLLPQSHIKLYWQKAAGVLIISAPSLIAFTWIILINKFTVDSYGYSNHNEVQFMVFSTILISGYFLNTWLSLIFEKYSFFLSLGLTCGWFFLQIFTIEMSMLSHIYSIPIFCCIGVIVSHITLKLSLKKLKKHSLTS